MRKIEYQRFELKNGLRVIIHEDASIPKAAVNLIYRVGSKDEAPHLTGFAHLFEHLMFRGSKHIPSFDRPLEEVGGQNNASTSADVTHYYINLPANQLETAFWLESDRMLELAFSEEGLEKEKSVVIEEYKQRYLNQPYGDAYLKIREMAYQVHPYQWNPIGKDMSHIEQATLQDVKDFFYGFYAPNNATLVVAGDVKTSKVLKQVEKWFGDIPSRTLKKHVLPVEPKQTEAREATVYGDVPFPAVYKMYHMPAHGERGYYVADLLADILAYGKSAILPQYMVREKKVSPNASAFTWGLHDPGVMSVDGRLAKGISVAQYEKTLAEAFDQIFDLTPQDLERIKGKLAAVFVMNQMTVGSTANRLAHADVLGNPGLINETPEIYQSISLKEVKAAAEQILAPTNCSTLYYLPKSDSASS
ncbi:pitrilysin family protein [Pontibacter sp. G13]|uniref:M16 family metallopeptidase n=1 Tax=Pontibacter sp. G13 TaxID=3074898 RepID=UPI00288BF393|nr:pitrilysin family protein [Pontibacter sp. G13]WNJ16343.1 pitrilysin family protein [Pontibacter sp. G13]